MHVVRKLFLSDWVVWVLSLLCCWIIAAFLCIPWFGHLPNGLNRDEAALGYNAYSLLKTGRDEFGVKWPVSITSFGDQKLPVYVYTLIPFIAAFGLKSEVIRLPSLMAGFVVIAGMGLLALRISTSLQLKRNQRLLLSFLTMLFIAVSPWSTHFSRVAYEAHLSMALFILGFLSYISAIASKHTRPQRMLLIFAGAAWSLTLLTYHSYQILTPLFICGLAVLDFARIKKLDKVGVGTACLIGVITVILLYKGGVWQANQVKNSGITPFRKEELLEKANEYRAVLPGDNAWYERVFTNPAVEGVTVLSQNLTKTISGDFFFVHGSGHGDHNPGNMNNFHLYVAPLLLFGLLELWEYRKDHNMRRISLWLCFGLLAPALTIQPNHEVRMSPIFPLLEFVGAFGAVMFVTHIRQKWIQVVVCLGFLFVVFISSARFFIQYAYIIPSRIESHYSYEVLAHALQKYQSPQVSVITNAPNTSPYIWYLVDSSFDPALLQSQIERYPADKEGFLHVKRIGKLYFITPNWDDLLTWSKEEPLIIILNPKEIPTDKRKDPHMTKLDTFTNEHGEVIYEVWKLNYVNKIAR